MLLWLVNTPGCLRECMMGYLDEVDFWEEDYAFPAAPGRPCCDRHTSHDGLEDELRRLLYTRVVYWQGQRDFPRGAFSREQEDR
jgi:hypothetical protein